MYPMTAVHRPASKGGRPPIAGTILVDGSGRRFVCVRCAYSLGEDVGGTGGPRVEVWIALAEDGADPLVVRGCGFSGTPLDWSTIEQHEIGIREGEVIEAIRLARHCSYLDAVIGDAKDLPTSTLDHRVLLPGDPRFPRTSSGASIGETLSALIHRRNTCPDEDVAAIDAQLLNLAPRA